VLAPIRLLTRSSASVSPPLLGRKLTDLFASRPQVISTVLLLLLLLLLLHGAYKTSLRLYDDPPA